MTYINVTNSTQQEVKNSWNEFEKQKVIYSNKQLSGYGRTGNWDGNNDNLYFSLGLKTVNNFNFNHYYKVITVAVYLVIKKYCPQAVIKIPNDIFIDGLKVAGILIEPYKDGIIVGVGININEPQTSTRIGLIKYHKKLDIHTLANELNNAIINNKAKDVKEIFMIWKKAVALVNRKVEFIDRSNNRTIIATISDIDYDNLYYNDKKINIMQAKIIKINKKGT